MPDSDLPFRRVEQAAQPYTVEAEHHVPNPLLRELYRLGMIYADVRPCRPKTV